MNNQVTSLEEIVINSELPFAERLRAAKPGDVIAYHAGSSLRGCKDAKAALAAQYRGEADLYQRKIPGSIFVYLAVKRREVELPPVPHRLREMVDRLLLEEAGDE
jgi:hypothetical protein